MIHTDTIIINSMLVSVYILTYYDGIKEEVDIHNNTLFLWYDELDDFEIWLKIKLNTPATLIDYLRNKIGVMDVINSSSVELCKRSFGDYKRFLKYEDLDLEEIEFPENERLSQDFTAILNTKQTIRKIFVTQSSSLSLKSVDFKQSYNEGIMEIKFTSSNDAIFDSSELMAA